MGVIVDHQLASVALGGGGSGGGGWHVFLEQPQQQPVVARSGDELQPDRAAVAGEPGGDAHRGVPGEVERPGQGDAEVGSGGRRARAGDRGWSRSSAVGASNRAARMASLSRPAIARGCPGPVGVAVAGSAVGLRELEDVYSRHRRWSGDGTWERIFDRLRVGCDLDSSSEWTVGIDATVARGHQHAAGARHAPPTDIPAERLVGLRAEAVVDREPGTLGRSAAMDPAGDTGGWVE